MTCIILDELNNETNKLNELNKLYKIEEPSRDVLYEVKTKLFCKKKQEKEKQLKYGIYKWILIYTIFYIIWASINVVIGLQKNRLLTSKVGNISISLKDYFMIISYLQIPLYLFTIIDVIYFNIPDYEREKICDPGILMMLLERTLFTMTHISIIVLIFVAIFISSKLSFTNHEFIIYIIIFLVQTLVSIMSILHVGTLVSFYYTLHNVIKEVNLYDTDSSEEEVYEEYYNQYI